MFWALIICSSTFFFYVHFSLEHNWGNKVAVVHGSVAHNMFLASHIYWVGMGTGSAQYCWDPWEMRGARPTKKKCRRRKGMRFTESFQKSELSWPKNLRQQVTLFMVTEIKWFRSPKLGVSSQTQQLGHCWPHPHHRQETKQEIEINKKKHKKKKKTEYELSFMSWTVQEQGTGGI